MTTGRLGVLLLNLGGPDSREAIKPFLTNLFNDREIIRLPGGRLGQKLVAWIIVRARLREVERNYDSIAGRSPILERTTRQARALERTLREDQGVEALVRPAMRYWHPFAEEALAEMTEQGIRRIVALSLYPQYSMATTGSSVNELRRVLQRDSPGYFDVSIIDRWPTLPGYLDALARRVEQTLADIPEPRRDRTALLFSAHGLPADFIERGDPYLDDVGATVEGVLKRLSVQRLVRLGYQSRVGPVKWLEPRTEQVLRELADAGCRDVVVIPISFVADHIETLYEIDQQLAGTARELGYVTFRRTRALDDDPTFIGALARLLRMHLVSHG